MRTVRAVAALVVVVLVAVWLFAKVTTRPDSTSPTLGDSLRTFATTASSKVRLSPDGTRLAIVQDGQLSVIRVRDASVVTRAGSNVVDAAWMPDGGRVLVVEGPTPTGEVAVVGMDGHTSGVTHLAPSIGFGNGSGLAVNTDGTRAAAIAVTRDAIGGAEHHDLATIDLQSGAVRVYNTPMIEESSPVFVNDDSVAVAAQGATGQAHLDVVVLADGSAHDRGVIYDGPFVTTTGGEVVVGHRAANGAVRLVAVTSDGEDHQIAVLKSHRQPVDIDPHLTRAVVRIFGGDHGERLAIDPIASEPRS